MNNLPIGRKVIKKAGSAAAVLGLLALLPTPVAWADQAADSGIYVSGAIGYNQLQSGLPDESRTSFRLAAGWQFHPHFSVEAGYDRFGEFSSPTPAFTDFEMSGMSLSLLALIPFSNDLALYGRLGQSWWETDSSYFFFGRNSGINQTGTLSFEESDLLIGLGVSYEVSRRLELDLELTHYDFEFPDYAFFDHSSNALLLALKIEL